MANLDADQARRRIARATSRRGRVRHEWECPKAFELTSEYRCTCGLDRAYAVLEGT